MSTQSYEVEGLVRQAPRPRGPRVLVEVRKPGEKMLGMFVMAEETKKSKEYLNPVCRLVAISPDAFLDKSRYPNGRTAELGEWVITNPYSGERHEVKHKGEDGKEVTTLFRILYDDEIKGVVEDPDAIVVVTD